MSAPAPGKVAYTNARVIDPATGFDDIGQVITDGETITAMGANLFGNTPPSDATLVNCGGHILAPGIVDMRAQLREPGETHKETLQSAGLAAVAGGVTSVACLPNTDPVMDDVATIEYVARRARKLALTKVYTYGAVTKGLEGSELAEMGLLAEAGALAFTDAEHAIANAQTLRRALAYARTFDLMIIQHPEEPSLAGGVMNAGALASRLGLSGIPREAEIILLERDMRLVEMTGGRYHAAHISTSESIEIIRRAKEKGLPVTCDVAPFYFALNEQSVTGYRTFAKLSPPLRADEDRLAIVAGIKDGVVDAIASDHAPQDQDSKRQTFAQAAFGGSGLETLLAVSLNLHHAEGMALIDVLRHLTCAPANLLGLKAGRLEAGYPADLVLFDAGRGWKIVADDFLSKSKNSPFDGLPVQGRVLKTIIDGREVFTLNGAS